MKEYKTNIKTNAYEDLDSILRKLGESPYKAKHYFLFLKSPLLIKEIAERWMDLTQIQKFFLVSNLDTKEIELLTKSLEESGLRTEKEAIKKMSVLPLDKRISITKINHELELKYIDESIKESEKCKKEKADAPKVGVVIIKDENTILKAYRGEKNQGSHAEFVAIEKAKERRIDLQGSILITTLEPCTTRYHKKKPCAQHILDSGIKKVIVGMIDPNPEIRGKGIIYLQMNGIEVELFPPSRAKKVREINQDFINNFFKNFYKVNVMEVKPRERNRIIEGLYESDKIDEKSLSNDVDALSKFNKIQRFIIETFTMDKLRALAINLEINLDEIPGETLSTKSAYLLLEMKKGGDTEFKKLFRVIEYLWPDDLKKWRRKYNI